MSDVSVQVCPHCLIVVAIDSDQCTYCGKSLEEDSAPVVWGPYETPTTYSSTDECDGSTYMLGLSLLSAFQFVLGAAVGLWLGWFW